LAEKFVGTGYVAPAGVKHDQAPPRAQMATTCPEEPGRATGPVATFVEASIVPLIDPTVGLQPEQYAPVDGSRHASLALLVPEARANTQSFPEMTLNETPQ